MTKSNQFNINEFVDRQPTQRHWTKPDPKPGNKNSNKHFDPPHHKIITRKRKRIAKRKMKPGNLDDADSEKRTDLNIQVPKPSDRTIHIYFRQQQKPKHRSKP